MLSASLLAFMTQINAQGVAATKSSGPLVSINLEYKYPFPWERVADYVLAEKRKGPPDEQITLVTEGLTFHYSIPMPWYARILLGPAVLWDDVITLDRAKQHMTERGCNTNLTNHGTVTDTSHWVVNKENPQETWYTKQVDFNVKASWSTELILRVSGPLIRWFRAKSALMREIETAAIAANTPAQSATPPPAPPAQ